MSTNTEKSASRPSSAAAQNSAAPDSTIPLDTNGDKSSVADDNQQNASALLTLASTFLPDGSSLEPVKANSSRPPSATGKPQSRASSAVTKSNTTNAASSGSRPASAKPNVDDSTTTTTVEKTSNSRVSSATKTHADANTPVDDESHGYSINIGALPSSATPNSDAPANSRPPSASVDAKQGGSRPASAGQSKPTGSRPPSAANNKAAGSQAPSASVKSDQENQHSNPTEPVIGHPTAKKESNENNHANASNILTESNPSQTTSDDATATAKSPRPGSSSKN